MCLICGNFDEMSNHHLMSQISLLEDDELEDLKLKINKQIRNMRFLDEPEGVSYFRKIILALLNEKAKRL